MKKNEFWQPIHNLNKNCKTKFQEPYVLNWSITSNYDSALQEYFNSHSTILTL